MKKLILLFALALITIGISSASPLCATADSASAASFFDAGCVIDDKLFSSLIFATDSGAEIPTAAQVKTIVLTDLLTPGSGLLGGSTGEEIDSLLPHFATALDPTMRMAAFLKMAAGAKGLLAGFPTPVSDSSVTSDLSVDVAKDILVSTNDSNSKTLNSIWERFLEVDTLANLQAVPEPTSVALLGVALIGGGFLRRRMQS